MPRSWASPMASIRTPPPSPPPAPRAASAPPRPSPPSCGDAGRTGGLNHAGAVIANSGDAGRSGTAETSLGCHRDPELREGEAIQSSANILDGVVPRHLAFARRRGPRHDGGDRLAGLAVTGRELLARLMMAAVKDVLAQPGVVGETLGRHHRPQGMPQAEQPLALQCGEDGRIGEPGRV